MAVREVDEGRSSKWWVVNTLVLCLLAAVCYFKVDAVREVVDTRVPFIKERTARFFLTSEEAKPAPVLEAAIPPQPPPAPVQETTPPLSAESTPAPAAEPMNVHNLAAHREEWPKTVALKKATVFPAVMNGKVIGKIVAPVGAQAKVIVIEEKRIGLEYQGGGAYLPPTDTDVLSRVGR